MGRRDTYRLVFPLFSWVLIVSMSFLQVKLSRLCEQDKILQELEARIRTLKDDKVLVWYKYRTILLYTMYSNCVCVPVHLSSIHASCFMAVSLVSLSRTSWSLCWMFPTSRWSSTEISRHTLRRLPISRNYYKRMLFTSGLKYLKSPQ